MAKSMRAEPVSKEVDLADLDAKRKLFEVCIPKNRECPAIRVECETAEQAQAAFRKHYGIIQTDFPFDVKCLDQTVVIEE